MLLHRKILKKYGIKYIKKDFERILQKGNMKIINILDGISDMSGGLVN